MFCSKHAIYTPNDLEMPFEHDNFRLPKQKHYTPYVPRFHDPATPKKIIIIKIKNNFFKELNSCSTNYAMP